MSLGLKYSVLHDSLTCLVKKTWELIYIRFFFSVESTALVQFCGR